MRSTTKTILSAIAIFLLIFLTAFMMMAAKPDTVKTKKIGSTIVPDTTKIYQGVRGGKYIWKLSKTGKVYKMYLKK